MGWLRRLDGVRRPEEVSAPDHEGREEEYPEPMALLRDGDGVAAYAGRDAGARGPVGDKGGRSVRRRGREDGWRRGRESGWRWGKGSRQQSGRGEGTGRPHAGGFQQSCTLGAPDHTNHEDEESGSEVQAGDYHNHHRGRGGGGRGGWCARSGQRGDESANGEGRRRRRQGWQGGLQS
jgi:hypothetical protein